MQAAKAPTPGRTIRSAAARTSGSGAWDVGCDCTEPGGLTDSAFSAERRLPDP
jgi:hypothetical protein